MSSPTASCTDRRIVSGSRVSLALEILLEDGTPALTTDDEPLSVVVGAGELAPGLEALLLGCAAGDRDDLMIAGGEIFGPHDPDKVHWMSPADFPAGLVPGSVVAFDTPGGQEAAGTVLEVAPGGVRVDFNHPLSARALRIRLEILAVEPSP